MACTSDVPWTDSGAATPARSRGVGITSTALANAWRTAPGDASSGRAMMRGILVMQSFF